MEVSGSIIVLLGDWIICLFNILELFEEYLVLVSGSNLEDFFGSGTDICFISGCVEWEEVLFYFYFLFEGGFEFNIQKFNCKVGEIVMMVFEDIEVDIIDFFVVMWDGCGGAIWCVSML